MPYMQGFCLQEDSLINHIAAKIVENVATTKGQVAQKIVTVEMAQSLWFIFKHSTLDALRITALSVSPTPLCLSYTYTFYHEGYRFQVCCCVLRNEG